MLYFQEFPHIDYRLTEGGDSVAPVRLSRNVPNMTVKLAMNIFDDENLPYVTYRIKDRDRPDTVAAQMYGASRYAWVILLANNMRDWYDWPLDDREFVTYMARKYETTTGALDGLDESRTLVARYEWVRTDGQVLEVDETAYSALPESDRRIVTVYDDEYAINDARRLIRVPTFEALPSVLRQFQQAVAR